MRGSPVRLHTILLDIPELGFMCHTSPESIGVAIDAWVMRRRTAHRNRYLGADELIYSQLKDGQDELLARSAIVSLMFLEEILAFTEAYAITDCSLRFMDGKTAIIHFDFISGSRHGSVHQPTLRRHS